MILVKEVNVSLELRQLNVKPAKVKVQLILDKVLCKFKWDVLHVVGKEIQILILVLLVKDKELLIELNKKQSKYQLVYQLVKI